MQPLLDQHASCVAVDRTNPSWHLNWKIGAVPGWCFIPTDTPFDVLRRQMRWADTYLSRDGRTKSR